MTLWGSTVTCFNKYTTAMSKSICSTYFLVRGVCVCVCGGGGGGGTVEQCKPSFDPQQVHIYLKAINLRKCIGNEQNNCSRYMAEQKFHSPPHDNEMVVPFTLK